MSFNDRQVLNTCTHMPFPQKLKRISTASQSSTIQRHIHTKGISNESQRFRHPVKCTQMQTRRNLKQVQTIPKYCICILRHLLRNACISIRVYRFKKKSISYINNLITNKFYHKTNNKVLLIATDECRIPFFLKIFNKLL